MCPHPPGQHPILGRGSGRPQPLKGRGDRTGSDSSPPAWAGEASGPSPPVCVETLCRGYRMEGSVPFRAQ